MSRTESNEKCVFVAARKLNIFILDLQTLLFIHNVNKFPIVMYSRTLGK